VLAVALTTATGTTANDDGGLMRHLTKEQALNEVAFPDADEIERHTLFLEPEQQQALSDAARSEFDSRLLTVYAGQRDGEVVGYAFIDSAVVRTKLATTLVVLGTDGSIREARVLAWQEPPEYQPAQRWLDRFLGRRLDGSAFHVGRDVDAISGATLSVQMFTSHVRRALAVHELIVERPALAGR